MDTLHAILNYSVGNFTVGKILSAVLVFVICYVIQRLLCRLLDRLLSRISMDATLRKILRFAVKLVLWFITAMIVIETLGVSVTSMLAAFSVVGLAASLAVQDSLANLASGIMLLISILSLPQMIAELFCHRFRDIIWLSGLINLLAGIGGLLLSYWLDVPAGATIVFTLIVVYLVAKLLTSQMQRTVAKRQ